MDQGIFQLRYRLCKQIALLFLLFTTVSCSSQQHIFQNGKKIAVLGKEIAGSCEGCYLLTTEEVAGRKVGFKVPVSVVNINNESISVANYNIEKKEKRDTIEVNASSFSTSVNYKFIFLKKPIPILSEILLTASDIYKKQIGDNDIQEIPSTRICRVLLSIPLEKLPKTIDIEKYSKSFSIADSCFHCPIKYSVEECLQLKKDLQNFEWND